jgi:hypothetical protein
MSLLMENLLLKKLQVKPGFKVDVFNAPADFKSIIGTVPVDISITYETANATDALLIFAITKADMKTVLDLVYLQIDLKLICWIIYPKSKSKLASDLNLMKSWDDLKLYNLTPCASAAINETWTALRIKPNEAKKKSGLGNTEIKVGAYGEFIDVANKKVTLPPEVKAELSKIPQALRNFEKLAYSHQKEYVLWILSAKQEKTRLSRLEKMLEMLSNGKKNPQR